MPRGTHKLLQGQQTRARVAEIAEQAPPDPELFRRAMALAANTAKRFRCGSDAQGLDWEDLLAEARAAAWQKLLLFDPCKGARLEPWIIAGCRSAIQDALRRADPLTRAQRAAERQHQQDHPEFCRGLWVTLSLDTIAWEGDKMQGYDDLSIETTLKAEDWQIEDATEGVAAKVLAGQAMKALAEPRERAVVELIGMTGASLKQAAEILGLPQSTCRLVWERAKERMRAAIGGML